MVTVPAETGVTTPVAVFTAAMAALLDLQVTSEVMSFPPAPEKERKSPCAENCRLGVTPRVIVLLAGEIWTRSGPDAANESVATKRKMQ